MTSRTCFFICSMEETTKLLGIVDEATELLETVDDNSCSCSAVEGFGSFELR